MKTKINELKDDLNTAGIEELKEYKEELKALCDVINMCLYELKKGG